MKKSLKILGIITITAMLAMTVLTFAIGGILYSAGINTANGAESSNSIANAFAGVFASALGTVVMMTLGILVMLVGGMFFICDSVFFAAFIKRAKGKSTRYIDMFILLFSILSVVGGIVIAVAEKDVFYIGLVLTIMALLTGSYSAVAVAGNKKSARAVLAGKSVKNVKRVNTRDDAEDEINGDDNGGDEVIYGDIK